MIDPDKVDKYLEYRYMWHPYNTDHWDVLWAALNFAMRV